MSPTLPRTQKGDETRHRILEAALSLFRERGFEGTGMREIADRAGVSLGSAYYYFESKDHLVQGIYTRTHEEHLPAVEPILAAETTLEARLRGLLVTKLATSEPYHGFAAHIFRSAADPKSPLSPFGAGSKPVRDEALALMRRVVEGSDAKLPADLRRELPELLWLYEMAIILHWIHDESPGRARTHRLIDHSVGIVVGLIGVIRLPLLGAVRKKVTRLLADLRGG